LLAARGVPRLGNNLWIGSPSSGPHRRCLGSIFSQGNDRTKPCQDRECWGDAATGRKRKESRSKAINLRLGQRLRYTGTSGWSVLRKEIFWSDEAFFVSEYNRPKRRTEGITTWSNGCRKRSRFGNAIQLRSEWSPHRPEAKRSDLVDRDSISILRRCKADSTTQEFPGIHSVNGWKGKK
jgi:hypothetical protein